MFKPKYRLLITKKSFPLDEFSCLGTQLVSIVSFLKELLSEHVWYRASVDAIGNGSREFNANDFKLTRIGTDQEITKYCSEIDQFIWGVFLCINSNIPSESIQEIEVEAEDKPFRPIACDGIILEIRAFDTSFFTIYSEDENIINSLSEKFTFSEKMHSEENK